MYVLRTYVCMYVCVPRYVCVYLCMCDVCMYYVRTYVCMCVCVYVCMYYVRTYVCVCVPMYVCTYVCVMYVCIYDTCSGLFDQNFISHCVKYFTFILICLTRMLQNNLITRSI
jgi:hypothetical protein